MLCLNCKGEYHGNFNRCPHCGTENIHKMSKAAIRMARKALRRVEIHRKMFAVSLGILGTTFTGLVGLYNHTGNHYFMVAMLVCSVVICALGLSLVLSWLPKSRDQED